MNKNAIPNDLESPQITSGIRLGTPAMTTRGFKEEEFKTLAHIIIQLLQNPYDENIIKKSKEEVSSLTSKFKII